VANPPAFADDPLRGEFARALLHAPPPPRAEPVKYRQWGEGLEHEAVMQMEKACLLPVAVAGALMPDAHVGYGLPIGGVLATDNAVIPYAVGVDIACRMKMTVLDLPVRDLEQKPDRLTRAIEAETRFGVGASFQHRRQHEVLDADWRVSPVTQQNKDRAWSQLGTSGSGNHFVEFGLFTAPGPIEGLAPGTYAALLSHSGSRGTGAAVCDHYSKLAFAQFKDLPTELKRLAWLSLDSEEGREYWEAMQLMGRYAAANHALIHRHIAENLGAQVLLDLENHHVQLSSLTTGHGIRPMSGATSKRPTHWGALSRPRLGAPTVRVRSARMAAPSTWPVSALRPEGTSTDSTGRPDWLIVSIRVFQGPSNGRFKPMPNRPSIIHLGRARRGAD
jgi:tRNA-splicing ligase RtcB